MGSPGAASQRFARCRRPADQSTRRGADAPDCARRQRQSNAPRNVRRPIAPSLIGPIRRRSRSPAQLRALASFSIHLLQWSPCSLVSSSSGLPRLSALCWPWAPGMNRSPEDAGRSPGTWPGQPGCVSPGAHDAEASGLRIDGRGGSTPFACAQSLTRAHRGLSSRGSSQPPSDASRWS